MDQLITSLWEFGAIGRLASQGYLDVPAPADDRVAVAAQTLLVEAGWLTEDPFGPGERMRSAVPPGVPVAAAAGFVAESLASVSRFAAGAAPGWCETDPTLIRWRGATSGPLAARILSACFAGLPEFPARLHTPGARFLDVGTGAGGIAVHMCREFPELVAVGLDVSQPALDIARKDVAAAGLADRIEIREQSVADLEDRDSFDLLWVPQPFIPRAALIAALPRLHRAARPGAAIVMVLASNNATGRIGAATEVRNAMDGGATMSSETATGLLSAAGFVDVSATVSPQGAVVAAVRP